MANRVSSRKRDKNSISHIASKINANHDLEISVKFSLAIALG